MLALKDFSESEFCEIRHKNRHNGKKILLLVLPAALFRQSSSLTSKSITTSIPLAGSAGTGGGRGSGASTDFFCFSLFSLPFPSLAAASNPLRAFSKILAWL